MKKQFYVYVLASGKNGTIYIGITSDLIKRIYEHKQHLIAGFTDRYNIDKLVYYEQSDSPEEAILREKQLKIWRREWKIRLIEKDNSGWRDLYPDLF